MGTFKNCKEVNQIMVMIIATIYIFLSENCFQKIFRASWKNSLPLFTHSLPLKIQKVQVPYLFANIENFSAPPPPPSPQQKGGEDNMKLLFPVFCLRHLLYVWPWKCDESVSDHFGTLFITGLKLVSAIFLKLKIHQV